METTIWCCFDAGVDTAMLKSEEKAQKKEEERFGFELALKHCPP